MGRQSAVSGAAMGEAQEGANEGDPRSQAIDREYLSRFTLGNPALEQEVLQLFAAQAPQYLEQLRQAKTAEEWMIAAHTIKGAGLAIGARRLASIAEMAERLDVASASAQSEGCREQAVEAVASALEEVCRSIERDHSSG